MLQLTPLDTPPPTTPSKSSVVDAGLSSSVSGSIRITGERVGVGRGTVVLTIILRPVVLSFSFCFSLRFSLGFTLTQRTDSRHNVGTTSSWENLLVLLGDSINLRGNKLSLMVKSVNTRIGKNLVLTVKSYCFSTFLWQGTVSGGKVNLSIARALLKAPSFSWPPFIATATFSTPSSLVLSNT